MDFIETLVSWYFMCDLASFLKHSSVFSLGVVEFIVFVRFSKEFWSPQKLDSVVMQDTDAFIEEI